jgi:hypothetical protein
MLTPTPVYLVGQGKVMTGEPGAPQYNDQPASKSAVVASLGKLDEWQVEPQRSMELEYYNFMTLRRKGDFAFEPVERFEGKESVLKVTPQPLTPNPSPPRGEGKGGRGKDTMPMYAVLAHKKSVLLPGQPTEIGAWINGNSGWGRLIFELTDASGQRWISVGAQQQGVPRKWLEAMIPSSDLARFSSAALSDWNTEDAFGISRINFDGWRYVAFPLPGNYPGEKYGWPTNSQWRSDRDGVVHYPLTLRKVAVELPEKVLHVKTFAPPARPAIYRKDLTVGQR